jgi:hypothetical protein
MDPDMAAVDMFLSTVMQTWRARADGDELLPTVLAQACVAVLPVAGAGLSVIHGLRVPLGSSDDRAAAAERLQSTLGEGPCLAAVEQAGPVVADAATIAVCWPVFDVELQERTPFRSVVSLPLTAPPQTTQPQNVQPQPRRFGALDLYLACEDGSSFPLDDAVGVAGVIGETLSGSSPLAWLRSEPATRRFKVWAAVGMLIGAAGVSSDRALALLRAYAFGLGGDGGAHDTLDDVAEDMTCGRLSAQTVLNTA